MLDCGLVESYVAEESMLNKIVDKWTAVNSSHEDDHE
jgi:hypothetical protein